MKTVQRMSLLANAFLLAACLLLLLRPDTSRNQLPPMSAFSVPVKAPAVSKDETPEITDPIEALAVEAPFVTRKVQRAYPVPPPADVVARLTSMRAAARTEHLGFLLEYGLRVHQKYLEHTRLSRELPLGENMMLAELVRLIELPEYANAHEAGWLNSQFYDEFTRTGYSSYQIYVWTKEHISDVLSDGQRYPNWRRIGEIMEAIDNSAYNAVGGGMVCHYHCL
jgi:hypothetical protein